MLRRLFHLGVLGAYLIAHLYFFCFEFSQNDFLDQSAVSFTLFIISNLCHEEYQWIEVLSTTINGPFLLIKALTLLSTLFPVWNVYTWFFVYLPLIITRAAFRGASTDLPPKDLLVIISRTNAEPSTTFYAVHISKSTQNALQYPGTPSPLSPNLGCSALNILQYDVALRFSER